MLRFAPPAASVLAPSSTSALAQFDALLNVELALLARAVGEHLPVELADRVLAVRPARRARGRAGLRRHRRFSFTRACACRGGRGRPARVASGREVLAAPGSSEGERGSPAGRRRR
jgi:hypothetical protein